MLSLRDKLKAVAYRGQPFDVSRLDEVWHMDSVFVDGHVIGDSFSSYDNTVANLVATLFDAFRHC